MKASRLTRTVATLAILCVAGGSACSSESTEAPPEEDERLLFPGTRTEFQIAIFECVRDAGFDVTLTELENGNGYGFEQHDDTDPEVIAAQLQACNDEIGYPPPEPETDDELREQYEHRLENYECLTGAGYDISNPPSFAVFLETRRASEPSWNPYQELQPMPEDALEACPRDVDTWWR